MEIFNGQMTSRNKLLKVRQIEGGGNEYERATSDCLRIRLGFH